VKLLSRRKRAARESQTPVEAALQPALVDGRWRIPERFNLTRDVVEILAEDRKRQALTFLGADGVIEPFTFRQLAEGAASWAAHLRERHVRPGDRVLVLVGKNPDWIEVMLAGIKVGAVTVPCSESLSAAALDIRVSSSDAKLVVAARSSEAELVQTSERPEVIYVEDVPRLKDHEPADVPTHDTTSRDLALILSTSATSSGPRGVAHTHGAIFAARTQAEHWLGAAPGHTVWCPADTGSALAVWNVLVGPWSRGAEIVLHEGPFDPEERLDLIRRLEITILCQTPAEYRALAETGERTLHRYRPYRLRRMVSTGDYLSPDLISTFEDVWDLTIHDGYGQAESGVVAGYGLDTGFRSGSMGLPFPGYELSVIDENGSELPPGAHGELALHGRPPSLFAGYWESPEETKAAFRGDLYLTGDVVSRDEDGFLWFLGRARDVITSGGIRFSPFEVEEALVANEAIAEAAVVGIRDLERGGQFVRAFVVLQPEIEGSEGLVAELREHLRQTLPDYKVPREIEFVDALPTTQNGKLRRLELRERLIVGPEPVWTTAPSPALAPEAEAVPELGPLADVLPFEQRLPDFVVPPAETEAEWAAREPEPEPAAEPPAEEVAAEEPVVDFIVQPWEPDAEPPATEPVFEPEPEAEPKPVAAHETMKDFVVPLAELPSPEARVAPEEDLFGGGGQLPDFIAHPASDYEDIPVTPEQPAAEPVAEARLADEPLPDYIAHPASDYEDVPVEPAPEPISEEIPPDAPLPDYIAHPASDYEDIAVEPKPELIREPAAEALAADEPLPDYALPAWEPEAQSILEPEPIPEPEPPPEPEPEPEPEPGPEPAPEPVLEAAAQPEPEPEPVLEAAPEPVFEAAEPEPEPEPVFEAAEPEPEPVLEAAPEPVFEAAEPEPEPEPVLEAAPEPALEGAEEARTVEPEERVWKIVSAPAEEPLSAEVESEVLLEAEPVEPTAEEPAAAIAEDEGKVKPRKRGRFRFRRSSQKPEPEPLAEAELEPVAKVGFEPEAEIAPEESFEPEPEAVLEAASEPDADLFFESEAEAEAIFEAEATMEAAAEPEPVADAIAEAEVEQEPVEEPSPLAASALESSAVAPAADEEVAKHRRRRRLSIRRSGRKREREAEPAPELEFTPVLYEPEGEHEAETEPVLEIAFEPAQEPASEVVFEAIPEAVPEPGPEPAREPKPQPVLDIVFEPQAAPEPKAPEEPVAEAFLEPAPEPYSQPEPERAQEPEPEPVAEVVFEPAPEPFPQPEREQEPEPEPVAEVAFEPAPEPFPQPEREREQEREPEPVAEVVVERDAEPEAEPVAEAVVEAEPEAAEEPASEEPEPFVELPPAEVAGEEEQPPEPKRRGRKKVATPSGKKSKLRRSSPEPGEDGESVDWMQGLSTRLSAYSLSDEGGEAETDNGDEPRDASKD
jgi:medium-chain acyl-CoA synthetase